MSTSNQKTVLDVFSNKDARTGEPFIVTDPFRRLRMSAGLVRMLNANAAPVKMYLAYDAANQRIALGPVDTVQPTDAKPVTFDAGRHYANARKFYDKHQIPTEQTRYVYDGRFNGWLMFRRDSFEAADARGTD